MNNYYDKNTQTLYIDNIKELIDINNEPINSINVHTDFFYKYTQNAPIVHIVFGDTIIGESLVSIPRLKDKNGTNRYIFSTYQDLKTITFGKKFRTIPTQLLYKCKTLEKVEFKGIIKIIDSYAFSGCDSLQEINLTEGLEYIGAYAFADCFKLDSITKFPTTLKKIGTGAFCNTNLINISFASNLFIKNKAFENCINLESVTFLKDVQLARESFVNCQRLKDILFNCEKVILDNNIFDQCLIKRLIFDNKITLIWLGGVGKLTHANPGSITSTLLGAFDIRFIYYNNYNKKLFNVSELRARYSNIDLMFQIKIFED